MLMSEPYQLDAPIEEELPLNSVPGTGVHQPEDTGNQVICVGEDSAASCCSDKYHRKLAISSIICGFSCLGVPALVYSVKAENADKAEKANRTSERRAAKYLRQAKKWSIISIVTWVSILVSASLTLVLLVLVLSNLGFD
ncbi:transmembrane protein 265-like [Neolamprologus brichardi]|uniref:transmembrane protein 265-like n=1 Tax=Neolamprologus brichardi TaxID=32507 RepID=UPI001643C780|nr:transmembrane protein 265-like [Neolamprologus brichardi]